MSKILKIELFDVWGIDSMGQFISLYDHMYLLTTVDYVSKWVEVVALTDNEGKSVVTFFEKNFFSQFSTPTIIISYAGSHFLTSYSIQC